tara:strand:- start:299 stop:865 length:567 start_codon:yes stop_codon:yes gene_type:complete
MKFTNTIQVMQQLGSIVVNKAKKNLKNKQTKSNKLYNGIDYVVNSNKNGVEVTWEFGGAEDYWQFVDQGVKGAGGYKGSGKMRGQGSDFRFGSGKGKGDWQDFKTSIKKWIANKPLKLRGADGKFVEKNKQNINSAAYLIQRAIYQRGLTRTLFFTKPYDQQVANYENRISQAVSDDLEKELEKTFKD